MKTSRANYFFLWHFSLASHPASFTLNRNNNASSLTWSRPQKFRSFPFPKLGAFSTPIGGRRGNFYSLLSTLWCRKWTTKRVASFQLNVSPGKTQAKTAMNARRTTSFFFSSKLLCNSNGERKRAILFELLGWKVYPSPPSSFSMRFHSLNNFVDFCFNERRRSYTVFLGRNRMNFSDSWIFFDVSSFLVYPFAQFVDKCFRYTWYRWLFFVPRKNCIAFSCELYRVFSINVLYFITFRFENWSWNVNYRYYEVWRVIFSFV